MDIMNGTKLLHNKQKKINYEEWSNLIAEWKSSTESQIEFCARLNLNINTFTYVKNKLSLKNKQKKFIPITIRPEIRPQIFSNMILENSKGMKLHIPLAAIDESIIHLLKIAGW